MPGIRRRRDPRIVIPPPNSTTHQDVTDDPNIGTEFGGRPGLIQPPPHELTPSETLMQIYAIDPADDGTFPESVRPPAL